MKWIIAAVLLTLSACELHLSCDNDCECPECPEPKPEKSL